MKISAEMNLINVTGKYRLGYGWFSTEGVLSAEIHSLKMDTIFSVEVNSIGMPQFNIESCQANDSYVLVSVDGSLSSLINSMSDILGEFLRDTLDQLLCDSTREAALAVKQHYREIMRGTARESEYGASPSYEVTRQTKDTPLCPRDPEYSGPTGNLSSSAKMSAFSINASMIENPSIFQDTAWIGLNGTMLYNGQNPSYQPVQYSLKRLK